MASEQHLVWASLGWHLQNTGGYGCTDSSKCRRDKQGRQKQSVRHLACNYSWWLVVLYSFPISQETTPALLITVYDVYSTTWFPFRLQPCRGGKKNPPKCPRKIQGYMATRKTPRTCHAFLLVSRLAALIFTCHRTHVLFFFFSFCYVWACVCLHYLVTTSLSHTTSQEEVKLATYVAILQDTDRSHHKWNSVWNLNTLGSSRHQPLMHVRKITHFEHVKQRGKGYKKWEKGPRETNSTRTHLVCCKNASTFAL